MAQRNIGDAYCYRVKGLFIPDQTPESIDKDIDNYISNILQLTQRLEDRFSQGDVNGFIGTLESIHVMLKAVFAKQCVSYTSVLMDEAKTKGLDHCGRLLQQAIADFLLLSIEMQKAQAVDTTQAVNYKQVEKSEVIARSLSAIERFLSVGNYEDAQSLASDMKSMDNVFVTLLEMLQTRQYVRAKELADAIEKEQIEQIQQIKTNQPLKTVMAVDDRPEILANVNAALRGHYRVLGAPGGKIALQIITRQKIDLFFLDIEMPEMDGFELYQNIRADNTYENTPIIFLTGNASRGHIEKGIHLGINDFIIKPSNHVNLLVKAKKYLNDQ